MTAQRREEQSAHAWTDDPRAAPQGTPAALAGSRVIKKLAPHQAGARRWALRHGGDLLGVRHRVDAAGVLR